MFLENSKQFLINATAVDPGSKCQLSIKPLQLEFIFDEQLYLLGSMRLTPATALQKPKVEAIKNLDEIHRVLFELNHIRVNPKLDNHKIITTLTNALVAVGIRINNPASHNSLAMCFQPLGEIQDQVRFYLKENNQVVFLSTNKPRLTIVR